MSGSALFDELIVRRRAIRKRLWFTYRKPILFFPPLPKQPQKSLDERIAEAKALRGQLPKQKVDSIIKNIRESAQYFGEATRLQTPRRSNRYRASHKIENPPSIEKIQRIVADHFMLKIDELLWRTRFLALERPRMTYMYLCRVLTNHSLSEIGRSLGRHHTSVFNAETKIAELIKINPVVADEISSLKEKILSL